jgi:hypothetical protein
VKSTEHVLIIGGGIGGMTLAAALHKVGIAFDVYEQAPELTEVGAGVGLWSNALFSLEQIGAADRVRRHCLPEKRGDVNAQGRVLSALIFDLPGRIYRRGMPHRLSAYVVDAIVNNVPQYIHTAQLCRNSARRTGASALHSGETAHEPCWSGPMVHSTVRQTIVKNDRLRYQDKVPRHRTHAC